MDRISLKQNKNPISPWAYGKGWPWTTPCPTFVHRVDRPNVSGVALPQGGWPAAISYPFGHPAPYAYESRQLFLLGIGRKGTIPYGIRNRGNVPPSAIDRSMDRWMYATGFPMKI
jgi:hypothetical protein